MQLKKAKLPLQYFIRIIYSHQAGGKKEENKPPCITAYMTIHLMVVFDHFLLFEIFAPVSSTSCDANHK